MPARVLPRSASMAAQRPAGSGMTISLSLGARSWPRHAAAQSSEADSTPVRRRPTRSASETSTTPPRTAPRACEPRRDGTALARRQDQRRPEPNLEDSQRHSGRQRRPDRSASSKSARRWTIPVSASTTPRIVSRKVLPTFARSTTAPVTSRAPLDQLGLRHGHTSLEPSRRDGGRDAPACRRRGRSSRAPMKKQSAPSAVVKFAAARSRVDPLEGTT
jgi:hypothetical protein